MPVRIYLVLCGAILFGWGMNSLLHHSPYSASFLHPLQIFDLGTLILKHAEEEAREIICD